MEVIGLTETLAMLDALPKSVVLAGYSKALHAAAKVIEDELDLRTPIQLAVEGGDLIVQGGELKAAIMHEVTLDSNYRGGYAEVGFGRQGYKANLVEYGHRMVGHRPERKQLRGPRTPDGMVRPYPFMRPTTEAAHEAAVNAFANSLKETISTFNNKVA